MGIDLGGTKVEACLVDETRKILARKRRPSEPRLGGEKVVANILELVADTAARTETRGRSVTRRSTSTAVSADAAGGAAGRPTFQGPA